MIKIERIESISGIKNTLESLEAEFKVRVDSAGKGFTTPLQRIRKGISKNVGRRRAILDYCETNFFEIIVGKPSDLEQVILHFAAQGWDAELNTAVKVGSKKKFKDVIFAYFGYSSFRSDPLKGIWFADQVNIKACPYCNSQYTLTTREKGNPKRARFQFDHFFAKANYPYLSISMYNLVPACADCNLSKSDEPTNLKDYYHPYHSSIANKCEFLLDNEAVLKKLLISEVDKSLMKIKYQPIDSIYGSFVKKHNEVFDIEGIYENHADYAEELLVKALMYPESRKSELMSISGLFKDEATFYRYLLGNYHLEEDILKRPLAKFTQDIAKQLRLI
jgi:hypothetical protein